MSGRVLFEELSREGWAGVEALVTERLEESVHLDFKSPPTNPQHIDDLVGKALSGFANVEGGLLVIGIRTSHAKRKEPDRADAIVPVKDVDAVARRLDQRIASLTEPPVAAVQVKTIPDPSHPSRGVLLIYTPASDGGPHRDGTERYMMRTGTNTEPMPHALLAARFGRSPPPKLRLHVWLGTKPQVLFLVNEGRGPAQDILLRVSIGGAKKGTRWTSLIGEPTEDCTLEREQFFQLFPGLPTMRICLRSRHYVFPEEHLPCASLSFPGVRWDRIKIGARIDVVGARPVHVDFAGHPGRALWTERIPAIGD